MKNLGGWLQDLLFPKFCVSCRQEGVWLCDNCLRITVDTERLLQPAVRVTTACLDAAVALFQYGENNISALIRMLKYNFLTETTAEFEKIIAVTNFSLPYQDFTIIPVPLHPRRERERGFNQAALLAQVFAQKLKFPINFDLRRRVYTKQQATLLAADRNVNLLEAFTFEVGAASIPEKALLVDDVFTTGATMDECAKTLKQKGVKIVWGLAMAHGG